MKSVVLTVIDNNDCNNLYFDDLYVDYLIIKKIYTTKSKLDDIYLFLNNIYQDKAVVNKDVLLYYLNNNFDMDSNDTFILSDKQKKMFGNTLKKFYNINLDNLNIDISIDSILSLIYDVEVIDSNDDVSKSFEDDLLKVLFFYKKNIYDYKIDYYEAIFYNIIYQKELYLSLIKDFLDLSMNYNYNFDLKLIFNNIKIKEILKLFRVRKIKELTSLKEENLLIMFPFDFRIIIDTFNKIPPENFNSFVNKSDTIISKLKDNYLLIIKSRTLDNLTLQEIGEKLGITRERVRQIEEKTIRIINCYYIGKSIKFLNNLYQVFNKKDEMYIQAEKYFNFFEDDNVKIIVMCCLKTNEKINIRYDDYYSIIFDSGVCNIEDILNEETKMLDSFITIEEFDNYNSLIKKYILDNYNLKKEKIYLKKGLNEYDLYLRIIDKVFPDGFKINDKHDYNLLMENLKKEYGIEKVASMRYISAILDRNDDYCQNDRGKYIQRNKLPNLPTNIFIKIKSYIVNSNYVVYYLELLNVFKKELSELGIDNQYMLKGILDHLLTPDFKTSRDYISYGNQKTIWDGVLNKIRNYDGIFNIYEINEEFPNISYAMLQGILSYEINTNGLLFLYNNQYVYANKTNINLFKDKIVEKVNELFKSSNLEFVTAAKVYATIVLSNDNFLTNVNFRVDEMNMYSIIKYIIPNDYIYRRPMIIKLDSDLKNTFNVISKYLNEYDEFDDNMLIKYINKTGLGSGWYYNYNSFCEYMSDNFVRVDKKRMVKKEKINVDEYIIKEICNGLNKLFYKYDEVNLTEFKAYFIFPILDGYDWNEYLLVGIINSYLNDKFIILRKNGNNVVRRVEDEL